MRRLGVFRRTLARTAALLCLAGVAGLGACTRESTRVALETQRRADEVQQAVLDHQHEALCILLYRDLLRRLEATGVELSSARRAALNDVWNERDLLEVWVVQSERARALRIIGVDAKLYGDQSIIDLLWKAIQARADRARAGLAAAIAERAVGGD